MKTLESIHRSERQRDLVSFLLIRHAESEANAGGGALDQGDSPLTERGRGQARALAAFLGETPLLSIHTSDLVRAYETATLIAQQRGGHAIRTSLLREPASDRRATAFMRPEEVAAVLSGAAALPPTSPVKTETHAEVVGRLRRFLDECWPSQHGSVVICSHFVLLNILCRLLLDVADSRAGVWADFNNASVTRIDVPRTPRGQSGRLVFLNLSA